MFILIVGDLLCCSSETCSYGKLITSETVRSSLPRWHSGSILFFKRRPGLAVAMGMIKHVYKHSKTPPPDAPPPHSPAFFVSGLVFISSGQMQAFEKAIMTSRPSDKQKRTQGFVPNAKLHCCVPNRIFWHPRCSHYSMFSSSFPFALKRLVFFSQFKLRVCCCCLKLKRWHTHTHTQSHSFVRFFSTQMNT